MIQPINDGGPAYPTPAGTQHNDGPTLRQYAAIKLCVPDSGLPWLDEMIVQSNRERLAAAALQGLIASRGSLSTRFLAEDDASYVYEIADAMLKAREAK